MKFAPLIILCFSFLISELGQVLVDYSSYSLCMHTLLTADRPTPTLALVQAGGIILRGANFGEKS